MADVPGLVNDDLGIREDDSAVKPIGAHSKELTGADIRKKIDERFHLQAYQQAPAKPPAQADSAQEQADAGSKKAHERTGKRDAKDRANRRKSRIALIIGIVFLAIAVVIGGMLLYRYMSAESLHQSLVKAAGMDATDMGQAAAADTNIDDITINWDALRAINPDVVGWVLIPDTRINYPIVQTTDNDYYLSHLFDGTPNYAGSVFLDYESDPGLQGRNNFLYGHNLLDGSMFASLKQYQDKSYFDAHKTIFLSTPTMNYRLEVIACLVCEGDDTIRQFQFADDADYDAYFNMLMDYSVYNELTPGEIPDKIYCLVTCTDTNYTKRTLVMAKIVDQQAPKAAGTATDTAAGTPPATPTGTA